MDVKISIITVVYNAAGTIERTIKSVIDQSYKNIEYIIIDGGSTDGTLDIIARYHSKLAYFVSEPDKGIYDAMNKGIKKASGDTIGLLNADDWYEPGALEVIAREYKNTSAHIIAGKTFLISKEGEKILCEHRPLSKMWEGLMSFHQAIFISKEAYSMYGLYDTQYKIVADHDLILRMYHGGCKVVMIDDVLVNFSSTGISSTAYVARHEERYSMIQKYMDYYFETREKITLYYEELIKKERFRFCRESAPAVIVATVNKLGANEKKGSVIWGTGVCGNRIAEFFYRHNVAIDFFVDSDKQKQGTKLLGKDIRSPEKLRDYEGTVFIAVKKNAADITEQLESLQNRNLSWISIDNFAKAVSDMYKETYHEKKTI